MSRMSGNGTKAPSGWMEMKLKTQSLQDKLSLVENECAQYVPSSILNPAAVYVKGKAGGNYYSCKWL